MRQEVCFTLRFMKQKSVKDVGAINRVKSTVLVDVENIHNLNILKLCKVLAFKRS